MALLGGALPADLAEHEAHRVRALEQATRETREARELVQNLTRSSELVELLRSAPGLIASIRAQATVETAAHHRVLERHEACATQLEQARRELEATTETVQRILEIAEVEPKLTRINALIDLLDRAELIQWRTR